MDVSGDRPVGADSIGVAISGDHARVVVLPKDAVDWVHSVQVPLGAGYLPGSASGVFVGREQELTGLRETLTGQGAAAVVQSAHVQARAIHGLGGVGKSALALHYAARYRDSYTLVWWMTSESPEAIVKGFADITVRLCPQWAQTVGQDERAAWAIAWLQAHPGWLLIFDNVEDPAHLRPYLGTLNGGHHLATSRRATGWHRLAPSMALGLLPLAQASELLCAIAFQNADPTAEQQDAARWLARDLGCLPLALEQAGAYAYRTGTDLDTYRQSLGLVLDEGDDVEDAERTIARIWDHTLAAITTRNPLAVTLLNTMAWLAPDDIPRTLLAPLAPDPISLSSALGELHAYNMIGFTDSQGINVHRLVQTVLRTRAPQDAPSGGYAWGRNEAERAVRQALPTPPDDHQPELIAVWERLLPHVEALAETTPPGNPASTESAGIYHESAQYLHLQGRDAHTIPLRTAALAEFSGALGDTHPNTLISRSNLASACRESGDVRRAIPLMEATLAQFEEVLGDTHLDTFISRNNLASAYQEAGDLGRAISLMEATLAQCEEVLGDTHPDTLSSRNHLAGAYLELEDLERALPLAEVTLAQREEVLGDTHPDTFISRSNLANAYLMAGDVGRAVSLLEVTLAQCEEVLGDTHPDTFISRSNLANAYLMAGDVGRAVSLLEVTLAQCEEVLGDTHPATLLSRSSLAGAYLEAADLERAIFLFEVTLAQREKVLGDTHPSTLLSRRDLALARHAMAAAQSAEPSTSATGNSPQGAA
ncbi:FxSxx-COOH system tetratricopeptide repeat protein [Streptomyces cyaneofuscatus]|uniref:FxSxx-COOH system tetratricopeptide repeat protein n=1 Tax=Streptomyces cyaneofuscatus TaxID=66883 RepID=UPI002D775D5D|nr:FxSxx-COOH system tetratricopeptide repeat protein [Streptomyces cyaneofuscatus]WRO11882.1 FxSxx-COOH system tetratricopeptide repeat protein [Streptomyces cyaneofuscatus]